ncbi:MAG TPA: hypothetical protein VF101_12460 [Gaiellaceae bacterium]
MKRNRIIAGLAICVFAASAIAARAFPHRNTARHATPPPAASEMRALSAPQVEALPPQAARDALAELPGVRADQERQLIAGIGSKSYAVNAAPTTDGGVCMTTPAGGGCFTSFAPSGISFGVGMNNDGPASPADRELIAGVASDRVSRIDVVAGNRRLRVPLRDNAFVYEAPAVGVWADALEVGLTDGSKARVVVSNANRAEAIP